MDEAMVKWVGTALVLGGGATAIMDLWALIQRRWFGIPSLDYRLVGRWIGHFPRGRFRHDAITAAAPVRGEAAIGWAAHYAIGIAFAGLLLSLWPGWLDAPDILPALIVGVGSIAAPFGGMQPARGVGVAASRAPKPWKARFRSLVTHSVFALGLLLTGLVLSKL